MIEHFFHSPGRLRRPPFHHYVVPPPPSAGVGKFMEEKGTASLHPLPTPVSGVGGERSEPEGVSCLRQLI